MTNIFRKLVRSTGFDIVRYPYHNIPTLHDYLRLLKYHEIDLIFDIGANIGQYAKETFALGYNGKMVSFEPMSKEYKLLTENSKGIKNWVIAPQMAVGDADGEIVINISENSVSSSVLDLNDYTKTVASSAKYISSETVRVSKLSSVFKDFAKDSKNVFVKMDVQGFEENVLNGLVEVVGEIKGLHLEFSLKPLYKNQSDMIEILGKIRELGFEPNYFLPHTSIDPNGRLLQIDGVFFKK